MKFKFCIIFGLILNLFTHFTLSQQSGWFWQNPLPQGNGLFGLKMYDGNNAICVDWDNILKTSNGGENWQVIHTGFNTYNSQMSFID